MKAIKLFVNTITVILLIGVSAYAQDKPDSSKAGHKIKHGMMHDMMKDSTKMKNMHDMKINMEMKGMEHEMPAEADSSIIRKGEIDLSSIDENKNGKVYQCQMDYNVISDKPGTDPKCGMKLEEVSLKKAKENLLKNGFKVK